MRLRLVAKNTNWDFFGKTKMSLAVSAILLIISLISFLTQGLNFGIDFRGGTTIRTQSAQMVDVAAYRSALGQLNLGDVTISEVYDPSFQDDQNVAMIRIQAKMAKNPCLPISFKMPWQRCKAKRVILRLFRLKAWGQKCRVSWFKRPLWQ